MCNLANIHTAMRGGLLEVIEVRLMCVGVCEISGRSKERDQAEIRELDYYHTGEYHENG
jgi:hypothetical protein